MAYFSNFGRVYFILPNGQEIIVNDLTKFASFKQRYKDNPGFFLEYTIRPGERAEQISNRLYGDGRFAWTIYLFNGIYDIDNQWPLTDDELAVFLDRKYPGQDYADVHHYLDEEGRIADPRALRMKHGLASNEAAIGTFGLTSVTIGDYEHEVNEEKRKIKLVDPDQILKVERDLQEAYDV